MSNRVTRDRLQRLWPNRVHESNWLKSLACSLGAHRWQEVDLEELEGGGKARFCRWCAKIKRVE